MSRLTTVVEPSRTRTYNIVRWQFILVALELPSSAVFKDGRNLLVLAYEPVNGLALWTGHTPLPEGGSGTELNRVGYNITNPLKR